MATAEQPVETQPAADNAAAPGLIRRNPLGASGGTEELLHRQVPAIAVSGVIHLIGALLVWWVVSLIEETPIKGDMESSIDVTKGDDKTEEKPNVTNEDIGTDPTKQTNYNNDRIETVSVPGAVNLNEPVGIEGAPTSAPQTVSPPPGVGGGAGGGRDSDAAGKGSLFGSEGGYLGGRIVPGQMFGGRSGSTREKMVTEGGGNTASEAAVAKGLKWLQRQQKTDGHWSMVEGSTNDDFGATGLALLPYLAAGVTHRLDAKDPASKDYARNVDLGIKWLINKQQGNGLMGSHPTHKHYSHAIAVMALCEAYGMTNDPALRKPAQRGLDYLIKAQHSGGGFRYQPQEKGDTSVTGWCLQAMQSGKLAGLSVPAESFYKVGNFLDSVQSQKGAAYGYVDPGYRPNLNAVGLLCRAYLGWGPKNPAMLTGIENLKKIRPTRGQSEIYYYYYATQVIHFCGTHDDWHKDWNPKMRDLLVSTQDNSAGPNRGSWDPDRTHTGEGGGRMCSTCLSLLTLEVYYRHLPLYKRDTSGLKDLD